MQETRIAVLGCGGRMGRRLLAISLETAGGRLVAGTLRTGSPLEGQDLGRLAGHGEIGIEATSDAEGAFGVCDVAIDFTSPQATMEHLKLAVRHRKALVVGTTGLDDEQLAELREAAREVPILYARNMSLGINLLAILVEQAARLLGPEYDIEILEKRPPRAGAVPCATLPRRAVAALPAHGPLVRLVLPACGAAMSPAIIRSSSRPMASGLSWATALPTGTSLPEAV